MKPFFGILTNGITRIVVLVGPYAFKVARGERGGRCNAYEARIWKTGSPALPHPVRA